MSISHTCTVTNNWIEVDDQLVFSQPQSVDFWNFAKVAFKHLEIVYPKFYKMDRLCKLGFLAAEYLFVTCTDCCPQESTAIILGNASGSQDSDISHLENIRDSSNAHASPSVFVYTLPNIVIGEIAIRRGMKGENAFLICEGNTNPIIEQYAVNLLNSGIADTCLAGWVDYTSEAYLARICWMKS